MNVGKLCSGIGKILVGWTACIISGVFWSVNPALTLALLGLGIVLGGYGFKEVEECFTKSS